MNILPLIAAILIGQCQNCPTCPPQGYVVPGSYGSRVVYPAPTKPAPQQVVAPAPPVAQPEPTPAAPLVPVPKLEPTPDGPMLLSEIAALRTVVESKSVQPAPPPVLQNCTVELGPDSMAFLQTLTPKAPPDPQPPDDLTPVSLPSVPIWLWIVGGVVVLWLYSKYKDTAMAWLKANAVIIAIVCGGAGYAYYVGWIPPYSEWTLPDWFPQPPVSYIKPFVTIVEEAGERTPAVANVIMSSTVADYLIKRGGPPMRIVDDDDKATEMQPVIAAIRKKVPSGPGVAVYSSTRRQYFCGPLPKTSDGLLALVKRYGGK